MLTAAQGGISCRQGDSVLHSLDEDVEDLVTAS